MKNWIFFVLFLFLSVSLHAQTKVYLIPTLGKLHAENRNYTYEHLRSAIASANPDVILVEIRAEDMAGDTAYLRNNYPEEMRSAGTWFPAKTIEGFDWLGKGIEGRTISPRYWKDSSRIKALENLMWTDTGYAGPIAVCSIYSDPRYDLHRRQSLRGLIESNDALLVREYNNCLQPRFTGTELEELMQYYNDRHKRMQQNLAALLQKHTGKSIVILTGIDHYAYLKPFLQKQPVQLKNPY
jgi:hypothetical protein